MSKFTPSDRWTFTPEAGDLWDRSGQLCRVISVHGISVNFDVIGGWRNNYETIGKFLFGNGIHEPTLVERNGIRRQHGGDE
jgi:hypothetical protein